jgi:hypothetical protein
MAVTSVLEQTKRDEILERVMQENIQELLQYVIALRARLALTSVRNWQRPQGDR